VSVAAGTGVALAGAGTTVGVPVGAAEFGGVAQGSALGVAVLLVGEAVGLAEGETVGEVRRVGVLLAVGRGVHGSGVGGVAGSVGTSRSTMVAVGSGVEVTRLTPSP